MAELAFRALDRDVDLDWATSLLDAELGGRMQARRGELVDALEGSGLIATLKGSPVGLLSLLVDRTAARAEVRAIAVEPPLRRRGIGQALLGHAHASLRSRRVHSVWLTTTNDNLGAIAMYEGLGYRVVEVRHRAVDESRRTIKPSIPLVGQHGAPIRDELDLEKDL